MGFFISKHLVLNRPDEGTEMEPRLNIKKLRGGRVDAPACHSAADLAPASVDVPSWKCSRASWGQGLTLVHFSAQLEPFVWDRGRV